MDKVKTLDNNLAKDALMYGVYLRDVSTYDEGKEYRERIIQYEEKLYIHLMCNGELISFKEID